MSYEAVKSLGVTFRPIDQWPGAETRYRKHAPFTAYFGSTMELLGRELRALNAKLVVVQLAMNEADFRNDGLPRASARAFHPGVVLAFESKWGPLKYSTDEFTDWLDNLRAIALSMEALRKVDRYGVSKRGEQYTGWKALPMSTDPAANIETEDQAWRVIADAAGIPPDSSLLLNGISEDDAIKRAIKATHPDAGGDPDEFRRVMAARKVLA
jgi:hypothetical protein